MFWKRRRSYWTQTEREWIEILGRYNSEVARGIVHTDEWKAQMAILQERFDRRTVEDPPWERS